MFICLCICVVSRFLGLLHVHSVFLQRWNLLMELEENSLYLFLVFPIILCSLLLHIWLFISSFILCLFFILYNRGRYEISGGRKGKPITLIEADVSEEKDGKEKEKEKEKEKGRNFSSSTLNSLSDSHFTFLVFISTFNISLLVQALTFCLPFKFLWSIQSIVMQTSLMSLAKMFLVLLLTF